MAFKRKFGRRRFRRRRRNFKRRGGFVRRVQSVIRSTAEHKYIGAAIGPLGVTDTGATCFLVYPVDDGILQTERIGIKIRPLSFSMKGSVYNTSTTNTYSVTMILFRDTQQIADTAPTLTDVIGSTGTVNAPFGFLNNTVRGRFKIIKRETRTLGPEGDKSTWFFDWFVSMKRAPAIWFNGAASTDIQRNGIYLGIIGNDSAGTNMQYILNWRSYFTDT